jgi:hypothetical protein
MYGRGIDDEGVCPVCHFPFALFTPCDCDIKETDEARAHRVDQGFIGIAVVVNAEGGVYVRKTTSVAQLMKEEQDLIGRPTFGYQGPEAAVMFGEGDSYVGINFFAVSIATDEVRGV